MIAPTSIIALEAAIVARLTAKMQAGLAVQGFPDEGDAYRLVNQVGAALVGYRGARYTDPEDAGEVVQERDLWFDIHLLFRQLNGHEGSYVHLEAARLALVGFKVPGFRKMVLRREAFVAHKAGVWAFALTVSAVTVSAEPDEAAVSGVPITRLTIESPYTISEIPRV